MNKIIKNKTGFTLTFAILVSTLLLSLALSMASLTLKGLALSSIGKESRSAFYAADGGIECALYWDVHGRYINPSQYVTPAISVSDGYEFNDPDINNRFMFKSEERLSPTKNAIQCGDKNLTTVPNTTVTFASGEILDGTNTYYKSDFRVDFKDDSCALVEVRKYHSSTDGQDMVTSTQVISNGINDCTDTNNPFRVQRTMRLTYR